MPINQENFNSSLYDLLKTKGYRPEPIDSKGQVQPVPQDADVFKFEFVKNDEKYGTVYVTVEEATKLIVYYSDEVMDASDSNTSGTPYSDSWPSLLQHLKYWAQRRQLGFELRNKDHLVSDMAQREHMKNKEKLGEGYYPMGKKASYNDSIPQVKIILQHTRQIEEGEQRYRNIAKIFVENTNGERFAVPTTRPGIAKVYARHVAEGGTPYDDRGKHITALVEEYSKMAGFVRAVRNNTFTESAQQLVQEGVSHYQGLRESLSRMIGHRGYHAYFESWTPVLNEEETDSTELNELFVQETLDPRIESVMPILSKLRKKVTETKPVLELDEWADSVIEEVTGLKAKKSNEGVVGTLVGGAAGAAITKTPSGALAGAEIGSSIEDQLKNVDEDLDANQKRVGQLGPTEKVKKNSGARGKLVGANESVGHNSSEAVTNAIIRKIIAQHIDVIDKFGPEKIMAAAEGIGSHYSDLEEIGSSDAREFVKQAIEDLESGMYDHLSESLNESKIASTLGAMAASQYQPKVGDQIRTRKGGWVPGIVEKVGEDGGIEYCWFRHPEGKLYKTPCINVERASSVSEGSYHGFQDDYDETGQEKYNRYWDQVHDRQSEREVKAKGEHEKKGQVNTDWKTEGDAPNGKKYNGRLIIKSEDPNYIAHETRSFTDQHWGAKVVVDTVDEPGQRTVYFVDRWKYGDRPFKDSEPNKSLKFSEEGVTEMESRNPQEVDEGHLKNLALGAALVASIMGVGALENAVYKTPLAIEIATRAKEGDEQAKKDLHNLPVLVDRSGPLQTLLTRYEFENVNDKKGMNESHGLNAILNLAGLSKE